MYRVLTDPLTRFYKAYTTLEYIPCDLHNNIGHCACFSSVYSNITDFTFIIENLNTWWVHLLIVAPGHTKICEPRRAWTLGPGHRPFGACMDSLTVCQHGCHIHIRTWMNQRYMMMIYIHDDDIHTGWWYTYWMMIYILDPYPWKHYNILVDWHIFKVNIIFNLSRSHLERCPVLTMTPELMSGATFTLRKF